MFTIADAIMFLGVSAPVCVAIFKIKLKQREDAVTWREFKDFRVETRAALKALSDDQRLIAARLGVDLLGS